MDSEKEYSNYISYISTSKIISLLCVLIFHCCLFFANNPFWPTRAEKTSTVAYYLCEYMDLTIIATFVMASGYLFSEKLKRKKITIPGEIAAKTKQYIGNYLIYGALWLVPTYTLFDFSCFGRESGTSLLDGYYLMVMGVFSDHLWFLWMLFWIAIFWILCHKLLKGWGLPAAALIGMGYALFAQFVLADAPYFKISQIGQYVMVYFAGILLSHFKDAYEKLSGIVLGIIICVSFGLMTAYIIIKPEYFIWNWLIKIVAGLFIISIFRLMSVTKFYKDTGKTRIWKYLKKYSFEIYLFNMPFPYLYFRIIYPFTGSIPAVCIILNILLSFVSILCTVQICVVIKNFIKKVFASGKEKTK